MQDRLTQDERRLVADERARLRAADPRGNPQMAGCGVAFAGMVLMTLTPAVGGWFEIPFSLGFGILGAAVLLLFAGAAVALAGGSARDRGDRRRRAEAGAGLRSWDGDPALRGEALQDAVRLLEAGGGPADVGAPGPGTDLVGAVAAALDGGGEAGPRGTSGPTA